MAPSPTPRRDFTRTKLSHPQGFGPRAFHRTASALLLSARAGHRLTSFLNVH